MNEHAEFMAGIQFLFAIAVSRRLVYGDGGGRGTIIRIQRYLPLLAAAAKRTYAVWCLCAAENWKGSHVTLFRGGGW